MLSVSVFALLILLTFAWLPGSVRSERRSFEYARRIYSIRDVDFANIEFHPQIGISHYKLHHSHVALREGLMRTEAWFAKVWYFDSGKALTNFVLLSCGASCSEQHVLQVFEVRHDHLFVTQQLEFDDQAPGTREAFNEKTGRLTVVSRANDESAHCCPKNLDVSTYRWEGAGFRQLSWRRVPLAPDHQTR